MTDNEIIKALECCHKGNLCRSDCPYDSEDDSCIECTSKLAKDTLNLINRQKAELELKGMDVNSLTSERDALQEMVAEQKAEIERLQDLIISNDEKHLSYVATKMKKEQELVQTERIRGLEAEVERLKDEASRLKIHLMAIESAANLYKKNHDVLEEALQFQKLKNEVIKSEVRKEFAERVYRFLCNWRNWNALKTKWLFNGECEWLKEKIDNLLKEMESD